MPRLAAGRSRQDDATESELQADPPASDAKPDPPPAPQPALFQGSHAPAKLLLALVAFRLMNALLISTFFNPDEYWQSLEPAHRLVFGYGHLTWEWAAGVRGYCHPLIFAGLYKLLAVVGLDTAYTLSRGPRALQGAIGAIGDLYVYRISCDLYGSTVGRWALLCQMISWFNWYCLVRTFSNSLESVLITAAVFYLGIHLPPTQRTPAGQRTGLLAAALSVVIRPACLPFWFLVGLAYLMEVQDAPGRLRLVQNAAAIGGIVLSVSTLVDCICYRRWVLVLWEFAKFNLLEGGSSFYGSHPWHWNLSQGLPAVLCSYLPLLILGCLSDPRSRLVRAAVVYALFMSLPAHKEFRFLLPCLQLLVPVVGKTLHRTMQSASCYRLGGWLLLGLQAAMAAYFSSIHQFPDCSPPGWKDPVRQLNVWQQSFPGGVTSQSLRDSPQESISNIFSTSDGPFVSSTGTGAPLPTHVVIFSGADGLDMERADPEYSFSLHTTLNPWGFYLKDSFLHNPLDQEEYLVLLFAQ